MDVKGFGTEAAGGYVALPDGGSAIPVGSLDSVNGAIQGQQIAGSDNVARNDMRIQIVPAGSVQADISGMKEITGPGQEFHDLGGGETVRFVFSANELGLTITDQNGAVRQSMNGNLGSMAQQLVINGDGNLVRNGMSLTIGVDSLAGARQLNVSGALEAMKTGGF